MNHFDNIRKKIRSLEEIVQTAKELRQKKRNIVFTNGCFDIVHRGHVEYLAKASGEGDFMVVGLNSDDSVRRLKGENRPLQDEISRALVLASMQFVDAVVIFGEDTPLQLIEAIQPNILIKGADYQPENIVGYDVVTGNGGRVVTVELTDGYSTTSVINRMK